MKTSNKARLYIKLSSSENRLTWQLQRDQKILAQGDETDLKRPAPLSEICVLVPSTFILFREVPLARTTRQALEWALESFTLATPELFHLTLLRRENNVHHIAAVEHTRMQHWLELLAGFNISPDIMVPDCLALPEGTYTTMGDEFIARDKPWQGYCVTLENQPVVSRLRKTQAPLQPYKGDLASLCASLNGTKVSLLTGPYRKKSCLQVQKYLMPACLLVLFMTLALPPAYRGLSADYMAWKNRQNASDMFKSIFGKDAESSRNIKQTLNALRQKQHAHRFIAATDRHAPLLNLLASEISVMTWSPHSQQLTLVLKSPITRVFLDENQLQSVALSQDGLTLTAGSSQ